MQNQTITPVQVIQELMAMLTTRKEACEKIAAKPDAGSLAAEMNTYGTQSDKYISALQNELSSFGDAVMGDVDRDNAYHNLWRKGLEMHETASASQLHQHFLEMEVTLHNCYREYSDSAMQLPETLNQLLRTQEQSLQKV